MTAGSAASRRVLGWTPVAPLPASSPTRPTGITGRMSAPPETSSPGVCSFRLPQMCGFRLPLTPRARHQPLRRPQVLHRTRTPLPSSPPHPLASGQVVRSAPCGPLALIVEGTRRRRRASTTVRSGRSGKINSAGTNAQRGRPESGQLSGKLPRVQRRLARCPPRALTRWCVARGGGAARCAGRRCGPGGAARHAVSPVRAAPGTPRAGRRPRAVPAR